MKVILTASVSGLGRVGDVVEVKNGFARNFLIPNKKAMCMTKNNQKFFEIKKAEFEQANENGKKIAEETQRKLIAQNVAVIENASDDGRLYGSVNATVIAAKINEILGEKIVEKVNVVLSKPIKDIGVYTVKVDLHSDAIFSVKLIVSRSESEVDALIKAEEKTAKKDSKKEELPEEESKKKKKSADGKEDVVVEEVKAE